MKRIPENTNLRGRTAGIFVVKSPDFLKYFKIVGNELVQEHLLEVDRLQHLKSMQGIKAYYTPTREEIQTLGGYFYVPFDRYMNEMEDFFEEFSVEKEEDARDICRNIQRIIRIGGQIGDIMNYLENDLVMIDETVFPQFAEILMRVWNHTRMQMNRGYMPDENVMS